MVLGVAAVAAGLAVAAKNVQAAELVRFILTSEVMLKMQHCTAYCVQ